MSITSFSDLPAVHSFHGKPRRDTLNLYDVNPCTLYLSLSKSPSCPTTEHPFTAGNG